MSDELSADESRRWEAFKDAASDLAEAVKDGVDITAARAAALQAAEGLDHEAFLNARHLPPDAGEHAEDLLRILGRIADGWGRWISCDAGWYPIICRLDREIASIIPEYQINQVKEKFGGLRFYYRLPQIVPPDGPGPDVPADLNETQMEQYRKDLEGWSTRVVAYLKTEEGQAVREAMDARAEQVRELVRRAEEEATRTCEGCASPGVMYRTRSSSPWLKTLCPRCAASSDRDFISEDDWEDWWAVEEPRILARQRQEFRAQYSARRCLVASSDPSLRVNARRVRYVGDPDEVARLLRDEDFDDLWLDDSPASTAAIEALTRRFADYDPRRNESEHGFAILHPPPDAPTLWGATSIDFSALREKALKLGWSARSIWGE